MRGLRGVRCDNTPPGDVKLELKSTAGTKLCRCSTDQAPHLDKRKSRNSDTPDTD